MDSISRKKLQLKTPQNNQNKEQDSLLKNDSQLFIAEGLQLTSKGLDNYEKDGSDSYLGKGMSATVERYYDKVNKKKVALKKININFDENFFKQLKNELKILKTVKCENIVECYDIFYKDKTIYISMEYMDYGTLAQLVKNIGPLPEVIIKLIAFQVLTGLNFLHKKLKLVHRDIKPSNLLINSEGKIKIADFGVSGMLDSSLELRETCVGTQIYMSPERVKGEKYSVDSDLWSVGLSLLECTFGYFPLRQETEKKQNMQIWDWIDIIVTKEMPQPPSDRYQYSSTMKDFLSICLRKEPGSRTSAEELLQHKWLKKVSNVEVETFKKWLNLAKPQN